MTEYYQARVLDVSEIRSGSELTVDTPLGASVLSLYATSDFNDEGGQVEIDEHVYSYSTKDDDLSTITLTTPTVVAYNADEEVYLYPATMEKEAMVQVDEEDAVMARVPHTLYDAMEAVVRSEVESEAVLIYNEDGDWVVHDVLGSVVIRDAAYIDQASLEEAVPTGPTAPPLSSPTPVLVGGIHSILGKVDPIFNAQQYDIYMALNNTATPQASLYVGSVISNQFQIDTLPPGLVEIDPNTGQTDNRLKQGVTYYVCIVATNELDSAPSASPWVGVELRMVSGPDIAADFAYLGTVTFDQMSGGEFDSTVVWSGLLKTRKSKLAPGGEIDTTSYRGYGMPEADGVDAPLIFEVPFDGRPAFFAGDVQARTFTAYQGANLYGDANNVKANGGLYLESGQGGAVAAPTVSQGVPSVALTKPTTATSWGSAVVFDALACRGFNWDPDHLHFVTVQNRPQGCVFWGIDPGGTVSFKFDQADYRSGGVISRPGESIQFYSYAKGGNTAKWGFLKPDGYYYDVYTAYSSTSYPAITLDQDGLVRIAEVIPGSGGQIRVQRFNMPTNGAPTLAGTSTLPALMPATAELASVNYGAFDLGGPAHHVLAGRQQYNTPIRVTGSATVNETPELEWLGGNILGLAMNTVASASAAPGTCRWYGLGIDSRLYIYGTNTWLDTQTSRHVVGVTMATDTAESQVGDKVPFIANKRWTVTITAPALINPANRAGVYMWRGASGLPTDAQMIRQGYTAANARTLALTSISYSGAAPGGAPTSASYPSSTPAFLKSQGTDGVGSVIDLRGSGAGRAGPHEWDLNGRATKVAVITPSTAVTTFTVAQSGTWKQVILPGTFAYGGIGFAWTGSSIVVSETGLYFVSFNAAYDTNATGRRIIGLETYTTEAVAAGNIFWYDETSSAGGAIPVLSGATDVFINAGAKLRMIAYSNSGAILNVRTGAQLTIRKVG